MKKHEQLKLSKTPSYPKIFIFSSKSIVFGEFLLGFIFKFFPPKSLSSKNPPPRLKNPSPPKESGSFGPNLLIGEAPPSSKKSSLGKLSSTISVPLMVFFIFMMEVDMKGNLIIIK